MQSAKYLREHHITCIASYLREHNIAQHWQRTEPFLMATDCNDPMMMSERPGRDLAC